MKFTFSCFGQEKIGFKDRNVDGKRFLIVITDTRVIEESQVWCCSCGDTYPARCCSDGLGLHGLWWGQGILLQTERTAPAHQQSTYPPARVSTNTPIHSQSVNQEDALRMGDNIIGTFN